MTARWRLGTRNPFTVYRVADGAHDVEHAREHFVTAFRREEDADLAVDAVNAWAARWADPLSLDELTTVAEAAFECADITVEVREADGTESSLRRLVRCLRSAGLLDERRDRDDDGEDEDVADPCAEDYRGECVMPGHDHSESRRRTAMWTRPNSRTGQFANVPAASIARDEVTGIKAVLRDRNVTRDEDDSLADTVAQALDGHTRDVARLSTALGVSLDPDDPDPVGRLVEAAGKATEVEVVSESDELIVAQYTDTENLPGWQDMVADLRAIGRPPIVSGDYARTKLPRGSWVATLADDGTVQLDSDGQPWPLHRAEHLGNTRRTRERSFVVVYRAPAPAPAALAVGEVVESAADLERRASVGTIVEDEGGQLGKLNDVGAWSPHQAHLDYPVIVIRVGTGGAAWLWRCDARTWSRTSLPTGTRSSSDTG